LNEGIKSLRVKTALLNQGKQEIIKSIALNYITSTFEAEIVCNPPNSSKFTDLTFQIPFGFPFDVKRAAQNIVVSYEGTSFVKITIPESDASTDVEAKVIRLTSSHVPLVVFGDKHDVFNNFKVATTIGKTQALCLTGTASFKVSTAVGLLSLTDIEFSVESNIEGLQGLNVKSASNL
jgi:hypothetical protein